MKNKEHLSINGFQQIINIKASMNSGLSDIIKSNFNPIIPVLRPIIIINNISNANWVAGFRSIKFCRNNQSSPSKSVKIGYSVALRFRIYQHYRDIKLIKLIELLIKYLECGKIEKTQKRTSC